MSNTNDDNAQRVTMVSIYFVSHLALILAAFSLAVVLNEAGFVDFLKRANLWMSGTVLLLAIFQAFLYRKAPRMATAFGFVFVATVFRMLSDMSVATGPVVGLNALSILFMFAAIVMFVVEIRRHLQTRAR